LSEVKQQNKANLEKQHELKQLVTNVGSTSSFSSPKTSKRSTKRDMQIKAKAVRFKINSESKAGSPEKH